MSVETRIREDPVTESSYPRKKRRGDRMDGWILKDLSSFTKLVPHLMTSRNSSAIYFKEKIDVTDFVRYVEEKDQELSRNPINTPQGSVDKITYFNVFLAALVRLFTLKPHLNRFIAGRNFYQRKKIEVAFVAKKEFTEEGEETVIKESFDRDETLWSVVSRLNREIRTVKSGDSDDATDILNLFARFPKPVVQFSVAFLDFLNYIGRYPKDIYKADPMHASVFVTNLGSIGLKNVPYHHLYDRGTSSVFICLGEIHPERIFHPETGEPVDRYLVEISTTIDERISDGFYFIRAMNEFKEILNNPELLEEKLEHYPVDI
ncbi:hypothetical protein FGU46_10515 [Methanobacterium sp. CWC-01]|uniref:2-oxo acid dehydrogenase subunit E2 n=1 Tax=Methanobacterium aridiramus TaxID=2584467 RepID=UPI0025790D79|nr:2-oxo acid dehydrogenase subunit E2 [Methanobacterium sp. CWC-01]WJI10491.1 hypothetical protein FGU46_10515 [Methanobacterium sp. CWC-01]